MTTKTKKRLIRHEQWIEIVQKEGRVVVERYPSNEDFEKERLEMDPPPDLIYRRINFVNGVPTDYLWTGPTPEIEQYGGHFLQRISVEEWPIVLYKERESTTKQVISARRPLPRPEEFGPCPCARCTEERESGLPSRYSASHSCF